MSASRREVCANRSSDSGGKAMMPARILIVEDGSVLAKNMKTYLSRGASDVRTAADVAQALEMLDCFAPDALVLDYGLPNVDGLRTYAEIIRHQARKIECVMISGDSSEQLAQDAHDLGIRHIVCKPFRFSELQRLLEAPTEASASDAPDANE
jgi:DNA-binding response OmpR family regulator